MFKSILSILSAIAFIIPDLWTSYKNWRIKRKIEKINELNKESKSSDFDKHL